MPRLRKPIDGKKTYAIVQAEDEIASAGMIVGAGWAGARAMTSTSGPGVSLMNESIGFAYYAEIPCVFFIIQRGGPSTGLPTRTQQADISLMYGASHGDTRHIILIPHDMNSCFDLARQSFNYADRFQTPVFVAMDLDLGMNMWSSEPLKLNQDPYDHRQATERPGSGGMDQGRQKIPPLLRPRRRRHSRIAPCRAIENRMASYFTRGSGHDADANYSEDEHDYKYILDRLRKKFETARKFVPKPIIEKETRR